MRYCIYLILTVCLMTPLASLSAQKVMQLEKYGSVKSDRYYIGDDIVFALKNDDKGWYDRTIIDMDVDGGYLVFIGSRVHIDSIASIQRDRARTMQVIGGALFVGGANTVLFSVAYPLFNSASPDWVGVASGVGIMGLGMLLRKAFKKKQFKPGKRKRLRLLDLNFGPPVLAPSRT